MLYVLGVWNIISLVLSSHQGSSLSVKLQKFASSILSSYVDTAPMTSIRRIKNEDKLNSWWIYYTELVSQRLSFEVYFKDTVISHQYFGSFLGLSCMHVLIDYWLHKNDLVYLSWRLFKVRRSKFKSVQCTPFGVLSLWRTGWTGWDSIRITLHCGMLRL